MAERVVLHVGTMKSGTSYLQALLFAEKPRLAEAGVLVPGKAWTDQARAVRQALAPKSDAPRDRWRALVDEVRSATGPVVISMEYLGPAHPDTIAAIVEQLGAEGGAGGDHRPRPQPHAGLDVAGDHPERPHLVVGGVPRRRRGQAAGRRARRGRPAYARWHVLAAAGPGPDGVRLGGCRGRREPHARHAAPARGAVEHPGRAVRRRDRPRPGPRTGGEPRERVAGPGLAARAAPGQRAARRARPGVPYRFRVCARRSSPRPCWPPAATPSRPWAW